MQTHLSTRLATAAQPVKCKLSNSDRNFDGCADQALDQLDQPVARLGARIPVLEEGLQMVEGKKAIVAVQQQQAGFKEYGLSAWKEVCC